MPSLDRLNRYQVKVGQRYLGWRGHLQRGSSPLGFDSSLFHGLNPYLLYVVTWGVSGGTKRKMGGWAITKAASTQPPDKTRGTPRTVPSLSHPWLTPTPAQPLSPLPLVLGFSWLLYGGVGCAPARSLSHRSPSLKGSSKWGKTQVRTYTWSWGTTL